MTQEYLEEISGIDRSYISSVERGKRNISIGLKKSAKFVLSYERANEIVYKLVTHTDAQLATEYKVHRATIWKIRKGRYPIAENYIGDDAGLYEEGLLMAEQRLKA